MYQSLSFLLLALILLTPFSLISCSGESATQEYAVPGYNMSQSENPSHPHVFLQTNHGDIVIELYPEQAPETVDNFLTYVREGYYDNTLVHRVIEGSLMQAGAYNLDYSPIAELAPVNNESDNGLINERGTVSMVRRVNPDSATSQFLINLNFNEFLDIPGGYTGFGRVVRGMRVADSIARTPTGPGGPISHHVPLSPIIIEQAVIMWHDEAQ